MFRNSSLAYPLPSEPPKFCGIISQRYRPHSGSPARSFQRWIDKIKTTVQEELIPELSLNNMTITASQFSAMFPDDELYNLINIADFNSLIAQSQRHSVPVFALSDEQIDQVGKVLETMKESRDVFRKSFEKLANSIEIITGL